MSRKHTPAPPRRPVEDAVFTARKRGQFAGAEHNHLTPESGSHPWWARGPPGVELERMLTLEEVAELTGLSPDTLRRRYAHLIKKLSPRRVGMRMRDALSIGESEPKSAA